MSTVDISSMLCEKILQAKIYFPKHLVIMGDNADEAAGKSSTSDVELPSFGGDDNAICELIMEEDTAEEECHYPEVNGAKTSGDVCETAPEPTKSRSSSLCVSPGTADGSSFLSDALDELNELELDISPSRKVSLRDACKSKSSGSENSSQSDTVTDLPPITSPVKEDYRASQSYDENFNENVPDPTTSSTKRDAKTKTSVNIYSESSLKRNSDERNRLGN
ncbi:hypothetical protein ANCCAN_27650, partial [Ancylostoma caninum]